MEELKDKGHCVIQKWEENAKEFINSFTQLFGPDGTLNSIWSQSTGRIKRALSPAPSPPESPVHGEPSGSNSKRMANGKRFASNILEEYSDEEDEKKSWSVRKITNVIIMES